jgi:hypothetical protein
MILYDSLLVSTIPLVLVLYTPIRVPVELLMRSVSASRLRGLNETVTSASTGTIIAGSTSAAIRRRRMGACKLPNGVGVRFT